MTGLDLGVPPTAPDRPDVLVGPRAVLVVGTPNELTSSLTGAFTTAGAAVAMASPGFTSLEEVEACFGDAAATLGSAGPPDIVVYGHVDEAALEPAPLVELSDASWDRLCEAAIRAALWTAQAAYPWLRGRDGRLVFICPAVSLEGAAGLVPYATAVEAQRLLAKSAARRWGRDGITVNVVAPALAALAPGLAGTDAGRTGPAIPEGRASLAGAAAAAVWLASRSATTITGTTIGADGGAVMAP